MPTFYCDIQQRGRPLPHFWEHCLGSGHAALGLRSDWQEQMRRCREELGVRHVRFHGLLSDDMGTLVCQANQFLYSFLGIDRIFDFLLSIGMKPLVELSFMPSALASGGQTVMHYRANVTPPADYGLWAALIAKLAQHWIDRYGVEEVRTWPMEVWNEPNLPSFWPAGQDAYFQLYRYTSLALKEVDANLQVGGPVTAKVAWIPQFLHFCEKEHLPVDFVSTHTYPTDALGNESMDTETELANSRRRILREHAQDARRQAGDLPLYFTEWSSSSDSHDPLHDESFCAAFIIKTVLDNAGLVDGYSYWTFSDIFVENYIPSEPFYGGFGLRTLYDVAKPSYRAYALLRRIGNELLGTDGNHPTVDAWAIRGAEELTLLFTNWERPRHPIRQEHIHMTLANCPPLSGAYLQRIDADHANPKRLWRELGSPGYLNAHQVALLQEASQCVPETLALPCAQDPLELELDLPPQAVAAITLRLSQTEAAGAK